jgi:2,3-bisphosphoglycerate-independent phosphoglycerate mutase
MRILLKSCFASIGPAGNIRARDLQHEDCPYLAEVLDGIEIDGVRFSSSWGEGGLEIAMEGEGLSPEIRPNYLEKLFLPVPQITFKDPNARLTANVLNKFLRRANRILGQEPCNRGRMVPVNMVLIKDAESLQD